MAFGRDWDWALTRAPDQDDKLVILHPALERSRTFKTRSTTCFDNNGLTIFSAPITRWVLQLSRCRSSHTLCAVGVQQVDRIISDIRIQIEIIFAADGIGLQELAPLTRLVVGTGVFPLCLRGLRRIFPVAIHAPAKNRLEAVSFSFQRPSGARWHTSADVGRQDSGWLRGRGLGGLLAVAQHVFPQFSVKIPGQFSAKINSHVYHSEGPRCLTTRGVSHGSILDDNYAA